MVHRLRPLVHGSVIAVLAAVSVIRCLGRTAEPDHRSQLPPRAESTTPSEATAKHVNRASRTKSVLAATLVLAATASTYVMATRTEDDFRSLTLGMAVAAITSGAFLWWPPSAEPNRRSDLGAALIGGAAVAFAVFFLQLNAESQQRRQDELSRGAERRQELAITLGLQRDLTGIGLQGIDLSGMFLRNKVLADANLSDATLTEANLAGANLSGASLERAAISRSTFDGANLSGSDLLGASGAGASLVSIVTSPRTEWTLTDFREISLARSDLANANVSRSRIEESIFEGATLTGITLQDVDLSASDLSDADLSRAKLVRVDLSGAMMFNANLEGAILEDVCWDRGTFWPDDFVPPRSTCYFTNLADWPF